MVMILPFVQIYTEGITDANYYRPIFAILIILAEMISSIRLPYSTMTSAAGHFKQTRKGAWLEAILNLTLSIILVFHFGMVGVAIGTLVAMLIRTIEFMYHTSKYILYRKLKENIKRSIILILEVLILVPVGMYISQFIKADSYIMWVVNAIIIAIMAIIIVVPINLIVYKKDAKGFFEMVKNIFIPVKKQNIGE